MAAFAWAISAFAALALAVASSATCRFKTASLVAASAIAAALAASALVCASVAACDFAAFTSLCHSLCKPVRAIATTWLLSALVLRRVSIADLLLPIWDLAALISAVCAASAVACACL